MTAAGQPVTLTLRELTIVKSALNDSARRAREIARLTRPADAGLMARARECTDLAARLSFAVPGEPIVVTP